MTDQAVGGGHLPSEAAEASATTAPGPRAAAPRQDGAAARPTVPATAAAPSTGQFAGRRRELKALHADIARAGLDTLSGRKGARSRVLLIAGRPGSGRTALAEELLKELAGDHPDGVLRASLTGPDGEPADTGRTARELLAALGAGALRVPPRTSWPSGCARSSPGAGPCSSWTTPRAPTRSNRCCRTPRTAWSWWSRRGR